MAGWLTDEDRALLGRVGGLVENRDYKRKKRMLDALRQGEYPFEVSREELQLMPLEEREKYFRSQMRPQEWDTYYDEADSPLMGAAKGVISAIPFVGNAVLNPVESAPRATSGGGVGRLLGETIPGLTRGWGQTIVGGALGPGGVAAAAGATTIAEIGREGAIEAERTGESGVEKVAEKLADPKAALQVGVSAATAGVGMKLAKTWEIARRSGGDALTVGLLKAGAKNLGYDMTTGLAETMVSLDRQGLKPGDPGYMDALVNAGVLAGATSVGGSVAGMRGAGRQMEIDADKAAVKAANDQAKEAANRQLVKGAKFTADVPVSDFLGQWKRPENTESQFRGVTKKVEPESALVVEKQETKIPRPKSDTPRILYDAPSGTASTGGVAPGRVSDLGLPMRVPSNEAFNLAEELLGEGSVKVVRRLKNNVLGMFVAKEATGKGSILLNPRAAKLGEDELVSTLAHEIGHADDWLPDKTLKRGNALGRVFSLKRYMKGTIDLTDVTNHELRTELIGVSEWWRPYDKAAADKKYKSYRNSSKELYADAWSVLMNNPVELSQRAPKFSKLLFDEMGRKPEVKAAWDALQSKLRGGFEQVTDARLERMYSGYEKGREKRKAYAEGRQRNLMGMLDDVYSRFVGKERKVSRFASGRGRGMSDPIRQAMDELALADNENVLLASRVKNDVLGPLEKAGVTRDDLGAFMELNREIGGRSDIINPGLMTTSTGLETYQGLAQKLGQDKFDELHSRVKSLYDYVYETMKRATKEGVFSKELFDNEIEPNRYNYATFTPVKYVKDHAPAAVREMIGSTDAIANPFEQTLSKMFAVNRWLEYNKARRQAVEEIGANGFARKLNDGDHVESGNGVIDVMEKGQRVKYEVPKDVQAFFDKDISAQHASRAVNAMRAVRNVFHDAYVGLNPKFGVANIPRDFVRTWKGLVDRGGANELTVPLARMAESYRALLGSQKSGQLKPLLDRLVETFDSHLGVLAGGGRVAKKELVSAASDFVSLAKAYKSNWGSARKFAKGELDAKTIDLLERKAIGPLFVKQKLGDALDEFTGILRRAGIEKVDDKRPLLVRKAAGALESVRDFIATGEVLGKLAADEVLKQKGVGPKDRAAWVREFAATPFFMRGGNQSKWTNEVLMYSNVMLQALDADLKLATNPKTAAGWWTRTMAADIVPKLAMAGAAAGFFGDRLEKMYEAIPEYAKSRYVVIPYYMNDDGKVNYIRIPHAETGRVMASGLWKAMGGKLDMKTFNDVFGVGVAEMPGLNPAIDIALRKYPEYLSGENPVDSFYGKPIISRDAQAARKSDQPGAWVPAAKDMAKWTSGKFGVFGDLAFMRPGNFTGLSALFGSSDRGTREKAWDLVEVEEGDKALFRLQAIPEEVRSLVREYTYLNKLGKNGTKADQARLGQLRGYYKGYLMGRKELKKAWSSGDDATVEQLAEKMRKETERYLD